ncbi:MAG TPA: hypothetical protein VHV55_15020 [Pirellulales bacterium]|jgi:hypothetical protein|nr:hypothetical protein [Pirellulales bacterium]
MSEGSTNPSPSDSSPPPSFEQAAERAFWHRLWDMKKFTLWLAGPSALLVFLNQLVPFLNLVKPAADKSNAIIVEHRLAGDLPAMDPKQPALIVEGSRFDEASPQVLEVICRNRSQHPIFVQQATIDVLRVWKLQPAVRARGILARSAEYDVLLPANGETTQVEKPLNQEIGPNGLDRFAFKLGLAPSKDASARVFALRVRLACEGQTVSAGDFLCMVFASGESSLPPASANQAAITEIVAASGTRNQPLEKFLATAAR